MLVWSELQPTNRLPPVRVDRQAGTPRKGAREKSRIPGCGDLNQLPPRGCSRAGATPPALLNTLAGTAAVALPEHRVCEALSLGVQWKPAKLRRRALQDEAVASVSERNDRQTPVGDDGFQCCMASTCVRCSWCGSQRHSLLVSRSHAVRYDGKMRIMRFGAYV